MLVIIIGALRVPLNNSVFFDPDDLEQGSPTFLKLRAAS